METMSHKFHGQQIAILDRSVSGDIKRKVGVKFQNLYSILFIVTIKKTFRVNFSGAEF